MAGARTEKRDVAPFVTLESYISKIRYRHSTNAKFQDVEATSKGIMVAVDDLRSIPRHELSIVLDGAALPDIYKKDVDKLALVVLTRDPMLKKEHVLYRTPVTSLPESFVLDSVKLKQTSCRVDLPLEINICAVSLNGKTPGWPTRRGSRLVAWYLNLTNHSKGPRFPWVRKTAEEFKSKGLPPATTFYVHMLGEPSELLTESDTAIDDLLEVWVHEDAWVVLQQSDANFGVAGIQRLFVTQVTLQILELLTEPLSKGTTPAEKSVGGLLIEFIAEQAKADGGTLVDKLRTKQSTLELAPYVSTAFAVNKSMKRVLD